MVGARLLLLGMRWAWSPLMMKQAALRARVSCMTAVPAAGEEDVLVWRGVGGVGRIEARVLMDWVL